MFLMSNDKFVALLIVQVSQIRKTKEEKLGSQLNELQRAGY
jgi:hypothetical protein